VILEGRVSFGVDYGVVVVVVEGTRGLLGG